MKITDIQHGQVPGSTTGNRSANGAEEGQFQKIMEQVSGKDVGQGASAEGPVHMPVPGGVQLIPGLDKTGAVDSKEPGRMLLGEIRETLDMIDRYAEGLGNMSMPASDMRPLVEHLEARLAGLRQLETSPELPDKLRSIVSDLVITIGTETARFGRGDYD